MKKKHNNIKTIKSKSDKIEQQTINFIYIFQFHVLSVFGALAMAKKEKKSFETFFCCVSLYLRFI